MAISEANRKFLVEHREVLAQASVNIEDVIEVDSQVGRNRSAVLTLHGDRKLHLKQLQGEGSAERFARTLSFDQFAESSALFNSPHMVAHSREKLSVLFDYAHHDTKLSDLVATKDVPPERLTAVAKALANLHSIHIEDNQKLDSTLPNFPPVHAKALSYDYFENATFGELALWRIIQADTTLQAVLEELVCSPHNALPIHGDFRPDQVLLRDKEPILIDFEDFRLGDPARDLGSFLGEILYHGIREMVVSANVSENGELTHENVIENGVRLLNDIRPTLNRFWSDYIEDAKSIKAYSENGSIQALSFRTCGYMGWHLFDRSLVTSSVMGRLSANDRALSGIGRNIISNRESFVNELGLTL